MPINSELQCIHQTLSPLPTFDWRTAVMRPATSAGRFVNLRYNINPEIADVIAAAAGLGEREDAR